MYPGVWGERQPDRPAVVMGRSREVVTYAELDARSNRLAHLLRAAGMRRGDHIAVFMENHPRYMEVVWAGLRSGLYVTAVNSFLTAPEAAYIIDDCEARVLITSRAKAEVAEALLDQTPRLECRLMVDDAIRDHDPYEDAVGAYPETVIDDESAGATMLYSSGTTGRPRGVLRDLPKVTPWLADAAPRAPESSDAAQARPRAAGGNRYGFRNDMVYLSPAPLYHAAPLAFVGMTHRLGGTAVVMEKFDPVQALQLIERERVTHSQWVPTMFSRMLKLPPEDRAHFDLSSHEVAIHAAAPCPVPVKHEMMEWWGPILFEYYAGTEGIGGTNIGPEEWLEHPGSVGLAPEDTVFILDEDAVEVPRGQVGTIYFKSAASFEYKGDPEKTQEMRLPGGLATLGDVGYVDEDGYLFLTDRKTYMIISGGVNIYPREIEDALITHPKVADVAVFGIPNEDFGEEVKAAVQLMPGLEGSAELERELLDFCRERIARFKCPRSVDFEAELPRLPTGKLYKRLLRDPYWGKHGTRIV